MKQTTLAVGLVVTFGIAAPVAQRSPELRRINPPTMSSC